MGKTVKMFSKGPRSLAPALMDQITFRSPSIRTLHTLARPHPLSSVALQALIHSMKSRDFQTTRVPIHRMREKATVMATLSAHHQVSVFSLACNAG